MAPKKPTAGAGSAFGAPRTSKKAQPFFTVAARNEQGEEQLIQASNAELEDLLAELDEELEGAIVEEDDVSELSENDSSIVKLANQIITSAFRARASDIHVEPQGARAPVIVRYRIDGECRRQLEIPPPYRHALVQRLKIMSKLDISEKRLPQDGKIRFKTSEGNIIELRVATIPTSYGDEDVVMRILASAAAQDLSELGLSKWNYQKMRELILKPYGMFLVVGPTGSGKTTTLHAGMKLLNKPNRKILTAEDPVEITQPGLRQIQINHKIGLTFSRALRSFLRLDPDIIMLGEMRDKETATIAVEASRTGHMVLSTLHTNNAPETLTRLLDLGIDPLSLADTLRGVMAQRLVKRLCTKCRIAYTPSKEEANQIVQAYGRSDWQRSGLKITSSTKLARPRKKGCANCGGTGYKGRLAVHELLVMTDGLKKLIVRNRGIQELRRQAKVDGMKTLLQDGIQKAFQGLVDVPAVRAKCID